MDIKDMYKDLEDFLQYINPEGFHKEVSLGRAEI
jgi:hypothetical protein